MTVYRSFYVYLNKTLEQEHIFKRLQCKDLFYGLDLIAIQSLRRLKYLIRFLV